MAYVLLADAAWAGADVVLRKPVHNHVLVEA